MTEQDIRDKAQKAETDLYNAIIDLFKLNPEQKFTKMEISRRLGLKLNEEHGYLGDLLSKMRQDEHIIEQDYFQLNQSEIIG